MVGRGARGGRPRADSSRSQADRPAGAQTVIPVPHLDDSPYLPGAGHNFPPPSGGTWTADDISSVAAAFLADGQTPRRLADLALHCRNDGAVARRLQGAVRNFLRDLGRATDVGRLVVRLRRALRE